MHPPDALLRPGQTIPKVPPKVEEGYLPSSWTSLQDNSWSLDSSCLWPCSNRSQESALVRVLKAEQLAPQSLEAPVESPKSVVRVQHRGANRSTMPDLRPTTNPVFHHGDHGSSVRRAIHAVAHDGGSKPAKLTEDSDPAKQELISTSVDASKSYAFLMFSLSIRINKKDVRSMEESRIRYLDREFDKERGACP